MELPVANTFQQLRRSYIYLLREREFLLRGEPVFNLGITCQSASLEIVRFEGYKKKSDLCLVIQCPHATRQSTSNIILEKAKRLFQTAFEQHPDGPEYFRGNLFDMIRILTDVLKEAWIESTPSHRRSRVKLG